MFEKLTDLPKKAKEKGEENKKYFKKLRQKSPRNLDYLVGEIHEDTFQKMDCLTCANCCKTTGPLMTEADIQRISKYLKMKPAVFTATYLRIDEDNDWVLQQLPCPFLGSDNACSIYDVRPKACREYPHTDRSKIYQIADITVKNTAICPAAFRIVEEMKKRIPL